MSIEAGTQFIGVSPSIDLTEKKSTQSNSTSAVYTIEDIIAEVPIPAAPTTVVVTIPSSAAGSITYSDGRPNATGGILGMGTTPIELLPAPGIGKYYTGNIVFENSDGNTLYDVAPSEMMRIGSKADYRYVGQVQIGTLWNNQTGDYTFNAVIGMNEENNFTLSYPLNKPIQIWFESETDPTVGDGTLRAIITYTVRTFGA